MIKIVITATGNATAIYLQYKGDLKNADIVNVYPQAISRYCSDKNYQSGAQKHRNTQIISQPRGVNPTF